MNKLIKMCCDLVEFHSVTPDDDGCIEYIADKLKALGFDVNVLTFRSDTSDNEVKNLFAEISIGKNARDCDEKVLIFLGHCDVVPPGDGWSYPAFKASIVNETLYGRGIADMKGGIAAFIDSVSCFLQNFQCENCRICVLITADEEIGSVQGSRSLIDWALKNKLSNAQIMSAICLVGEPSAKQQVGDRVFVGHRGSFSSEICYNGTQGHVAYQNNTKNAISAICQYVQRIKMHKWKAPESNIIPETNAEPTIICGSNYASNVVPDFASAFINVRFSGYTFIELEEIFKKYAECDENFSFKFFHSANPYLCEDKNIIKLTKLAIKKSLGISPEFCAAGGTSDGRFICDFCPVIEFGLPDNTIHKKNECVSIQDIEKLKLAYLKFIELFFVSNVN